ncbi:MAG: VTT domain-containing protein [Pseudomonadota bacterium]
MSDQNNNYAQSLPPLFSVKRMLPFLVIIAAAVAGYIFLRDVLSFEQLAANQDALTTWRNNNYLIAAIAFIGIYTAIVAFSLPGAAIASLTGGFLFGLFPGAAFNIVAATLGATCIFLAARFGFGDALSAKMDASEGVVKKFKDGLKEDEVSYLLIMRLIPAVPFFVANLIPALVGVSLWRFIWTTFVGIIPGGIVYTWIGAGLSEVFARGEAPNLGIIFEPYILGPLIGLAVLALLPILYKKFIKKA